MAWLSNCSLYFCLGQPLDHYVHHNGALAKSTKNPVSHPAIVEKAVFHLTNLAGKALHTRLFRCFDILNLVDHAAAGVRSKVAGKLKESTAFKEGLHLTITFIVFVLEAAELQLVRY